MKQFLIVALLAATVTVQAQVTNLVKISALPTVTSIAGTEIVPVDQSGVTKSATVNQIVSGPVAMVNTASNYFQAYDTSATATMTANAATAAAATTSAASAAAAALAATNSLIQSAIASASNVNATATATLSSTVTANAASAAAAQVATNTLLQTQMSGLTGGLSAAIINGANGTMSTATVTNLVQPTLFMTATAAGQGSYTSNVNFSASFQKLSLTETGSGATYLFSPQNFTDGQTVTLIIQNSGGSATFGSVTVATNASGARFNVHGGGLLTTATGTASTAYLNWQCIGGLIIFSGTASF